MKPSLLNPDVLPNITPVFMYFTHIDGREYICNGMKSKKEGYIHKHIGLNQFKKKLTKIPENAQIDTAPSDDWIKEFFFNPLRSRVCFETLQLPPNACGDKYEIEFNGGVPFIVYINNGAIFVYQIPDNIYITRDDYSHPNYIDNEHIIYTELAWSCTNPLKIFIGKDTEEKCNGNNILVQLSDTIYMHIGCKLDMFECKDQILKFYSRMGNNNVPYPVALTKDSVIFMDNKDMVKQKDLMSIDSLPKENGIIQWDDSYVAYYDMLDKHKNRNLINTLNKINFLNDLSKVEEKCNKFKVELISVVMHPDNTKYCYDSGLFDSNWALVQNN